MTDSQYSELRRELNALRERADRLGAERETSVTEGLVAPSAIAGLFAFFAWQTLQAFVLGFVIGFLALALIRVLASINEVVSLLRRLIPEASREAEAAGGSRR